MLRDIISREFCQVFRIRTCFHNNGKVLLQRLSFCSAVPRTMTNRRQQKEPPLFTRNTSFQKRELASRNIMADIAEKKYLNANEKPVRNTFDPSFIYHDSFGIPPRLLFTGRVTGYRGERP